MPDAIFEFHTQQAIEKLLKALDCGTRKVVPFTHDLQLPASARFSKIVSRLREVVIRRISVLP